MDAPVSGERNKIMIPQTILVLAVLLLPAGVAAQSTDPRVDDLLKKVQELEARVKWLEADAGQRQKQHLSQNHPIPYKQMQARFESDRQLYPGKENEIEALYAITNAHHEYPPNPEALDAMNKLLTHYPRANRTGCAVLNVSGTFRGGDAEEQRKMEAYLRQAIANYSDSFFGNSVQVGAYARYNLAMHYLKTQKTEQAAALFEEIRKDYRDSVDHQGNSLIDWLPK